MGKSCSNLGTILSDPGALCILMSCSSFKMSGTVILNFSMDGNELSPMSGRVLCVVGLS